MGDTRPGPAMIGRLGGTGANKPRIEHAYERTRVLYVAGTGRSGSTLLAAVLGQLEGFFNAGEIRYVWDRGLIQNRLCGCGNRFHECATWQSILEEAFGSEGVDAATMSRLQAELTRVRHLRGLAAAGARSGRPEVDRYLADLASLYAAIAKLTGSRVIVDSSKLPSYGRLLSRLPSVDLFVIHLVRDPRAAAGSWAGLKAQPDRGVPGYMETMSPARSALLWTFWNSTARRLMAVPPERYVRLRYEDFVAEPQAAIARIVSKLGIDPTSVTSPFQDSSTVVLTPNHTVAGNPDRLKSGAVKIQSAAAARKGLKGRDRAIVTLMAMPLLASYRYRLRATGEPEPAPIGIQHLPGPLRAPPP